MNGLNPRARQRVETIAVRSTVKPDVSNGELFEAWKRAMEGKLAGTTLKMYSSSIGDALRYFTTSDGVETPVRRWSKADVWAWVHFVEANYCGNYQQFHMATPTLAKCRAKVWVGTKPAEEASATHCGGCPFFKRPPRPSPVARVG